MMVRVSQCIQWPAAILAGLIGTSMMSCTTGAMANAEVDACLRDYDECRAASDDGQCETALTECSGDDEAANNAEGRLGEPSSLSPLGLASSGFEPLGDVQLRSGAGFCAAGGVNVTPTAVTCAAHVPPDSNQAFSLYEMADGTINLCVAGSLRLREHAAPTYTGFSWRADCVKRADTSSNGLAIGVQVLSFKGCSGAGCRWIDSPDAFVSRAGRFDTDALTSSPLRWHGSDLNLSFDGATRKLILERARDLPRQLWERLPLTPPPSDERSWTPGNYIGSAGSSTDTRWNQIDARLAASPNWKGVLLRYEWDDLEFAKGVYTAPADSDHAAGRGFLDIDARLRSLANQGGDRKLILFIQLKSFGGTANDVVPSYMKTNLYSGGQYEYISMLSTGLGGNVAHLDDPDVRDRLIALIEALATRYFVTHPELGKHLEAVAFSEASINQPMGGWANGQEQAWFDHMTEVFVASKAALPNISIAQWINGPRNKMTTWVPEIRDEGVGLGMPDLCPDDAAFLYVPPANPGSIYHCQQSAGRSIIMGHASRPAYEGTVVNPDQRGSMPYPGKPQTRQDIQHFAKNTVGVTHLIWVHNTAAHVHNTTYLGQKYNAVTDAWISDPRSDISTVETRPTGW